MMNLSSLGKMDDDDLIAQQMLSSRSALKAPSGQAQKGEGDAIAQQMKQERETSARQLSQAAVMTPAQKAADALKSSRDTGVPFDVAQRNAEDLRKQANARNFAANIQQAPKAAEWFKANPNALAIAQDDSANLTALEASLQTMSKFGAAAKSGLLRSGAGIVGVSQAIGDVTAPIIDPLAKLFDVENPMEASARSAAAWRKSLSQRAEAAMPATGGPIEAGVLSGVASLTSFAASLPLAFTPAGAAGVLGIAAGSEAGYSYGKAKDQGKDTASSVLYGASQGAIEYATEKIPVGKLLSAIGSQKSISSILRSTLPSDVAGEQVATALQDLNEWAVLHPDRPFSEYIKERPNAALQTFVATLVSGGAQGAAIRSINAGAGLLKGAQNDASATLQGAAVLDQAVNKAQSSVMRERDQQSFEDLISKFAQSDVGESPQVHFSAQDLRAAGLIDSVIELMPELKQDIAQAEQSGQEFSIPVEQYLSRISDPAMHQQLRPFARFGSGGPSVQEALDLLSGGQEQVAQVNEAVAAVESTQSAIVGEPAVLQDIATDIAGQLEQTNRFKQSVASKYATLVASYYYTMAPRLGLTAQELYAQEGLRIVESTDQAKGFYDPEINEITLGASSDLSTFLHETGHHFLNLHMKLASRVETDPQSVNNEQIGVDGFLSDVSELTKWLGIEGGAKAWEGMSVEQQRQAQEKFAVTFEGYLASGQAPTLGLKQIFAQFRSWLIHIYRASPWMTEQAPQEVRNVMDRMLASEDAINAYRYKMADVAMFAQYADAAAAGLSRTQWGQYKELVFKYLNSAQDKVMSSAAKDAMLMGASVLRRSDIDSGKKEYARMEAAIKDGLRGDSQVYRTWMAIQEGSPMAPSLDGIDGAGLTQDQIHELIARDLIKASGVDAAISAEFFGFDSVADMLTQLASVKPLEEVVSSMTDKAMLAMSGEISSQQEFKKKVSSSLFGEEKLQMLNFEARILAQKSGRSRDVNRHAQEAARLWINATKVRALSPGKYERATRSAAMRSFNAFKSSNLTEAVIQKEREIASTYAARFTYDALSDVSKAKKRFTRLQSKAAQKAMRGEYRDQLNELLRRFGFSSASKSTKEIKPLAQWMTGEAQRLSAVEHAPADFITNAAFEKHYKDLTYEEFVGLKDTIDYLEHLARRENKMYQSIKKATYKEEVESILQELQAANPQMTTEQWQKDRMPMRQELSQKIKSAFDANFVNVENMIDVLTGGRGTTMSASLFGRISVAQDVQSMMLREIASRLKPILNQYSARDRLAFSHTKNLVPGTDLLLTREQRIAVALYNGSIEGRQRLSGGNRYDAGSIAAIVNSLDSTDVQLIKELWSISDQYIWPQLDAVNQRTTGVSPPKVEAAAFEHPRFGTLPGGYVPLVYDGEIDTRSQELNTENSVRELLGGGARTAGTNKGSSIARFAVVNRPLDLSIMAMASKINATVHDITHREAIADTYRILQNRSLANAIRNIAGPHVYNGFLSYVREMAAPPATPYGFLPKVFAWLRQNTMINMMGASFNTIAVNVLGVVPAIKEVGVLRFVRGVQVFTSRDAAKNYQFVLESSGYMRERLSSFDRELNQELQKIVKARLLPSMSFWFAGLSAMDRLVTMPTWMAAFAKEMDASNDHDAAVAAADKAVRKTQGSGRAADLAAIAGGRGVGGEFKRVLTMYYSFFSAQLGALRVDAAKASRQWDDQQRALAAIKLTSSIFLIVFLPSYLEALARGKCAEGDDGETDHFGCMLRSGSRFTASFFPVFRDVLPYAWRQFDPDMEGGYSVRISPVESALESIAKTPPAVAHWINGEGSETDLKNITHGIGFLFGLPGYQAFRTLDGYNALMNEETDDPSVLLTGVPKE